MWLGPGWSESVITDYSYAATLLRNLPDANCSMWLGISSNDEIICAAPHSIASRGMPKTTHEALSWATVTAPALRIDDKARAPS